MFCKMSSTVLASAASLVLIGNAFGADTNNPAATPPETARPQLSNATDEMRGDTRNWDLIRSDPAKAGDRMFVMHAGMANRCEIALSDLVLQKSNDQEVKDLAKKIKQEHTDAQSKLEPIAQKLGVDLPNAVPAAKQQELNVLRTFSAEELDKCFLVRMKAGHAAAISLFSDQSRIAKDEAVRNYAGEMLPALREHNSHVMQTAAAKGLPSDTITSGPRRTNEAGASINERP